MIVAKNSSVYCYELAGGTVQEKEVSSEVDETMREAETVSEFLDALGADKAQLLMHNKNGETKIECEANSQKLRAALTDIAS